MDFALRRARWGHLRDPRPTPVPPAGRALLDTLERDGIAIMAGYWSAERCVAAREAIDGFLTAHAEHVWADASGADRRIYGRE